MPTFSRNLEQTLERAVGYANERQHEFATLEHLLLAILDDEDAIEVLTACGAEFERLRADLVSYIDHQLRDIVNDRVPVSYTHLDVYKRQVYGDGSQTRSLCYVSDLVRGFVSMVDSAVFGPVNLCLLYTSRCV